MKKDQKTVEDTTKKIIKIDDSEVRGEDDFIFLKTIIPSRKATKDYSQDGD